MKILFENTEIAFKIKSDSDLRKAYYLFKLIGSNTLVNVGGFFTNVALKIHFPIGWAVRPTIYNHFVGGETIEKCIPLVRKMEEHNMKAILDYSVEGGENEDVIEATLAETIRTFENAGKDKNIPFGVFKPTAFAPGEILAKCSSDEELTEEEKKEADKFIDRIDRLSAAAQKNNIPLMIDAEDYAYQKFIDEVILKMMKKYNKEKAVVFNTLQMYRTDRLDFLKDLHQKSIEHNFFIGIKFVRGAYMEKERELAQKGGYPDPIHPNKAETDKFYNLALKYSVENIDKISIFNATHNEESSQYLVDLMEEHNIPKDDFRCYFSQLYGMSDNISYNLSEAGYNVAKYTPYGPIKHVVPYLLRRTQENTSVEGQTSRELNLLIKERARRKNLKNK